MFWLWIIASLVWLLRVFWVCAVGSDTWCFFVVCICVLVLVFWLVFCADLVFGFGVCWVRIFTFLGLVQYCGCFVVLVFGILLAF